MSLRQDMEGIPVLCCDYYTWSCRRREWFYGVCVGGWVGGCVDRLAIMENPFSMTVLDGIGAWPPGGVFAEGMWGIHNLQAVSAGWKEIIRQKVARKHREKLSLT